jgi:Ca2+-binding EF-hand superfamily protein
MGMAQRILVVEDRLHGAIALLRAADSDGDHSVSAEEWTAFLAGLTVDENGAVSLDSLADAIHAPAPEDGDTTRRDEILGRMFDGDGDGTVELSDLEDLFDEIDRTGDGACDRDVARGAPKALRKALRRHRRHR